MIGITPRLFGSNTVQCHTDHSPSLQCWSEVFFSIYLKVCYYR